MNPVWKGRMRRGLRWSLPVVVGLGVATLCAAQSGIQEVPDSAIIERTLAFLIRNARLMGAAGCFISLCFAGISFMGQHHGRVIGGLVLAIFTALIIGWGPELISKLSGVQLNTL